MREESFGNAMLKLDSTKDLPITFKVAISPRGSLVYNSYIIINKSIELPERKKNQIL